MIHPLSSYAKIAGLCLVIVAVSAQAQDHNWRTDRKGAVLFGLSQPLIATGFNVELNYIHNRFIVDFSHGVSLDFADDLLTPELQEQGVVIHMPWTTGFGAGYRFTEWLNLRVEPKWHRFEFYYNDEPRNDAITSYNTFTLGLGLYGFIQPFKNKNSFLKGLVIAPSVRYWPTVSSTLPGDQFQYMNKNTGTVEEIETLGPGYGFSPLVINISVGYAFGLRRN